MKRRRLTAADHIGAVCGCRECQDAGVAHEPQRRIPGPSGIYAIWAHGWVLRGWLDARREALAEMGHMTKERGR
jgi:hypothetical protein